VVRRAALSDGIFFNVFSSLEECYRAAYEQGLDRLSRAIADATGREHGWLERVRVGMVALLGFFDDEPSWARLLVLDTPVGAGLTLDCRRQLHDVLGRLLDRDGGIGEVDAQPMLASSLTGELTVGGVFSVIRTNMLEDHAGKLVELAPSLTTFIAVQYGFPVSVGEGIAAGAMCARSTGISRAAQLPVRATHRTTLVLRAIAGAPYSNNREVAQAAGLADEGQTSKLLARLESRGVIENVGVGAERGEPNAWLLTGLGRRAIELINESVASGAPRQQRARVRQAP
jgi:AcrR family transcriptional regulator